MATIGDGISEKMVLWSEEKINQSKQEVAAFCESG